MSSPINITDYADKLNAALFGIENATAIKQWETLPRFEIELALKGMPYMNRFDARRWRWYQDCRPIQKPHDGILIWAGEWMPYEFADEDEMWRLDEQFRMVPPERRMR